MIYRPRASVPPIGAATGSQLREYIDQGIYYTNRLRCRDASTWRRAELYDQAIQTWLHQAYGAGDEGGLPTHWREIVWGRDDPMRVPTPVFNEGLPIRMNESARLARPNPRPVVSPRTSAPSLRATEAAEKGTHTLRHRLREMGWEDHGAPLLYWHMPVYGGAWLCSSWDQSYERTTLTPAAGAVRCHDCGFALASTTVPEQYLRGTAMAASNVVATQGAGLASVRACPACPDHPGLMPYQPSMREAASGRDAVGRPLGSEEPLGDWLLRVVPPDDLFERNLGLDQQPGSPVEEVVYVHVETMDWVAKRWPEVVDEIEPENPATLAKYHPILSTPDLFLTSVTDASVYRDCVRVKELHRRPWMEEQRDERGRPILDERGKPVRRMNLGRSSIVAGNTRLMDGPYMVESLVRPGEFVERKLFDYVPWEYRDGGRRRQGLGLWENLFSPQDIRNEVVSQRQAVRRRLAVPIYLALREHNLEIAALRGGFPGAVAEIDVVDNATTIKPEIINNTTIDSGVEVENQDSIQFMERLGGRVEVEKGQVPTNVGAAQAIRQLKAAAAEGREPRIRRIRDALRRAYGHGLRLMQAFYVEARPVRYEDEEGEERWESFKGVEIGGEVDVETEPDFEEKAAKVETVKELIGTGVINPETLTRAQRRRIARLNDAPTELYEDEDLQEASSQREWIAFRQRGRVPQVDPELDDHSTHYECHGRAAHTEWFRDLEDRANWDGALGVLGATWYEELQALVLAPMLMPPAGTPGVAMMPGMAPPPQSIQQRIKVLWMRKLLLAAQTGAFQGDPAALEAVLNWRAHMTAHRLEDEAKQRRALMGPVLAAPGAQATQAGNQPTEAAPPAAPPPAAMAAMANHAAPMRLVG